MEIPPPVPVNTSFAALRILPLESGSPGPGGAVPGCRSPDKPQFQPWLAGIGPPVDGLQPHHHSEQLELFASKSLRLLKQWTKSMIHTANLSSTPALIMGMDETIIDRIAFGGVKELEEIYQQ
jgi:hypothetical protein